MVNRKEICNSRPGNKCLSKHTGLVTTAFNLKETICQVFKQKRSVYVATLIPRKAFDTMFFKVSKLGIQGKMCLLIVETHTDMLSRVSVNSKKTQRSLQSAKDKAKAT